MIDFKPIEEFTFDDCVNSIERLKSEGMPIDAELQARFDELQSSLNKREEQDYFNCNSIETLQAFITKYSSLRGASKYSALYISNAKNKIQQLLRIKRRKRLVIICCSILILIITAILICWIGYSPYEIDIPLDSHDGKYLLPVNREGGHISISYESSHDPYDIFINSLDENIDNLSIDRDSICFDVSANYDEGNRKLDIQIKGYDRFFGNSIGDSKNLTIELSQNSCRSSYLKPFIGTAYFKKEGSSETIEVETDGTVYYNGSKHGCGWLDVDIIEAEKDFYKINLTAVENNSPNRSDSIYLSIGGENKSIFVLQYGPPTYLSIEKSEVYIAGDGGDSWDENIKNGSVEISLVPHYSIEVNTDGEWRVSGIPSWIKIHRQIYDIINGGGSKLCFIVQRNNSSEKRSAQIRISSKWDENMYEDVIITQYPQ